MESANDKKVSDIPPIMLEQMLQIVADQRFIGGSFNIKRYSQ